MIQSFYVQVIRIEDHDRTYAVRVWRLEDWLDWRNNALDVKSIKPSIEFLCANRADAEQLADRLADLQTALAGGSFSGKIP